ncbi:MAG TPA: ROK family protein [Candidatus Dormibacteraeota bacterium]|nr:ROK family protein [Candidatus Dormibacteraeota bacterium]
MIGVVDIGGTKLAAGLVDGGRVSSVVREPTPSTDPEGALSGLLERAAQGVQLEWIGVAVPGPFDRARGALINPPGMPASWHGAEVAAILGSGFGCPVRVENDANCAALAEAAVGAGKGAETVVYYTVSTGIGSGVVRDGALLAGRQDTEGGHQVVWPEWTGGPPCECGGAGCLEMLASGRAIEHRFGRPPEMLGEQAAWDDVGRWLGLAVTNTTALLDPDVVVFGGGVTRSWARFAPALLDTVRRHIRLQAMPRIELGALPEDIRTLLGASLLS